MLMSDEKTSMERCQVLFKIERALPNNTSGIAIRYNTFGIAFRALPGFVVRYIVLWIRPNYSRNARKTHLPSRKAVVFDCRMYEPFKLAGGELSCS